MWANAQRDGRPAEYMWCPLFNAAVWLTPTTEMPCSNAAKTRNPLKLPGVAQTNETISAASGPKFTRLINKYATKSSLTIPPHLKGVMDNIVVPCFFSDSQCSGRQPNFAALNRGRHLYSAGRPSRWALAHTSSFNMEPRLK